MNKGETIISATPDDDPLRDVLDDAADAGPDAELRQLSFGAAQHGERLDRALAILVPEFSRSYLVQLLDAGAVTIGGEPATRPARRMKAFETGTIELRPTPQSQAFQPEPMDIAVVHEDEHVLVISKPPGLVVHPAPGNWRGTLLNGLLARDEKARFLPRAGIVHRLDKDTSGLMVVARTRQAMDSLVAGIAAREVSRKYLALAHRGWSGPAERSVASPIGRDPRNRLRMAVVDLAHHSGKVARTDVRVLDKCEEGVWVECTLHTGRTHQIRVHMASIGHPLVGDVLYGGTPAAGMERQALHAYRLAFAHPATGAAMAFESPLPDDLRSAVAAWGLHYNHR